MKNKVGITGILAAILLAGGVFFTNIEDELPVHPLKEYSFRTLERDLYITFHHTATEGLSLEDIASYHVDGRNWAGIAYHFAIMDNGDVFQLQKLDEVTYHTRGHNTEAIGIVFVGNYEERDLPDEAVRSAELLIGGLKKSLCIIGIRSHGDVEGAATLCMGKHAYAKMKHTFY